MNEISALHIFSGVSKPEAYLRHENEHTHKLDAVACAVLFSIKMHMPKKRIDRVDFHQAEQSLEVCGFHVWINQVQLSKSLNLSVVLSC